MWHKNFPDRLVSWNQLRTNNASIPVAQALFNINSWWFETPWTPYHLHWDDQSSWPNPWQLLDDNLFCPVARGLGILYTIGIMERSDMSDAVLIEVASNNLIQVCQNNYILNWDKADIVNINPGNPLVQHSVSIAQIKTLIK